MLENEGRGLYQGGRCCQAEFPMQPATLQLGVMDMLKGLGNGESLDWRT
jgi:hypothetical protein